MVYAFLVASLDGIEELHKGLFDYVVMAVERLSLNDGSKEVSSFIEVHDDVDVELIRNHLVQGSDLRMIGHMLVVCDLALLDVLKFRATLVLEHTLDGVSCWIVRGARLVMGEIYDPVGTAADRAYEA